MSTRASACIPWLLVSLLPAVATGQGLRVAAWAGFEGVTDSDDWSTAGAQVTATAPRGHALWLAAERLGRFGASDLVARTGIVLHPIPALWLSAEAHTVAEPVFAPKNAWEGNLTVRTGGGALGVRYRRQNYVVGAVDVVIPHVAVPLRRVTLEGQLYVSRNPSQRTDLAGLVRLTFALAPRAAAWVGAGAGRESYLVGAAPSQQVRSLDTVTGIAGARLTTRRGTTLRLDLTVVRSEPVLSRRGVSVGIAQAF